MKVAIIGTVGVPANYGGFETLVDQLVRNNKSEDLKYTVFCSSKKYKTKLVEYCGAKLKYVSLDANGIQSIPYDIISLVKATKNSDCILILGVSGCAFLPIYRLFSKKRLVINIDGLEHKREKWNKYARWLLKFSEKQAIKYGNVIVSDNKGIADYVQEEYGQTSEIIAYGGDQVLTVIDPEEEQKILDKYNLQSGAYNLALCRIEPENNVHNILKAHEGSSSKLLFIGNWDNSEYGRELKKKYANYPNIIVHPAVYEATDINVIRRNCKLYIHGHSAGGTNPSLVEAMHFTKPIIAYDCIYNRETTENKAAYFKDSDHLKDLICKSYDNMGPLMKEIADRRYTWEIIARQYEKLYK